MGAPALLAGYAADIIFADPARRHPVAGFGQLATWLEDRVYTPTRRSGALALAALLTATVGSVRQLARHTHSGVTLAVVTWITLGGRSLRREAGQVELLIRAGQLDRARTALSALCGRDAANLDVTHLRAAVIESLAENTSDAVIAPLVWAALLGSEGAAGYRAVNTLDAMWGHRSERYRHYGWASARLDDLLNWMPARLTAALAMMAAPLVGGAGAEAWAACRRDGGAHPSPNAGVVEAAFAGALGLRLGGPLAYSGRAEARPWLGDGVDSGRGDVARAARLSWVVGAAAALLCAAATRGGKRTVAVHFPPRVAIGPRRIVSSPGRVASRPRRIVSSPGRVAIGPRRIVSSTGRVAT